jgi:hypothetical protein
MTSAMCAERFGSYSTRSTVAAMPSLSRLKSMIRNLLLCPPPLWRVVRRPLLLRAPVEFWLTVRDGSEPPLYRCERSASRRNACRAKWASS